ncbi:unnamed protein product [Penicillium roqueforti FM164]|uniref:Uncharacterized protein n=1 Tax=Penicillium roqueforti (strain FM164) TaxID=1365484 RepID=W6R6F8_PENRF|nr:unnamed protein product [Penicillium roqueforti FM164]
MISVEQRGEEPENAIQQSVSEPGCYKMRSQMDTSLLGSRSLPRGLANED